MSTTSLFVEILIIGFESLIWLGLILSMIWAPGPFLKSLIDYKEYAALIITILLAFTYVLGIIIDRIADNFYKPFRYEGDDASSAPVGEMRLRIMHESEGISKFFDYQRSRLRIARATVFNILAIVIVTVIWLIHSNTSDLFVFGVTIGIGSGLFILSLKATRRIDQAQMERLVQAYGIVMSDKRSHNPSPKVAAAVCYRRINCEIEFLLVRTKGGKYWTFPKGHVKHASKERPWFAARREAGEEAGAEGLIEKDPFTHYAYHKGGDAQEHMVSAFLMRVEFQREPDEKNRDPGWFSPEAAMKKLSKHRRKKRFILEHQRVIKEAIVRIERLNP